jgi:hypothetical protein
MILGVFRPKNVLKENIRWIFLSPCRSCSTRCAQVMTAYVNRVSSRAADDLVAALGIDTGISESEVSQICKRLDERRRPESHDPKALTGALMAEVLRPLRPQPGRRHRRMGRHHEAPHEASSPGSRSS